MGAGQHAASTSSTADTVRTGREGARARRSSRWTCGTPRHRSRASGRSTCERRCGDHAPDAGHRSYTVDELHDLRRQPLGRASPASPPTATSGNITKQGINGDLYLLETATGRRSSGSRTTRRSARAASQLLAGRPLDGLLGAGRPDALHHEEPARLPARGRRPWRRVAQAGRHLRRRRHHRLLVGRRQHDLLQRGREGDQPAPRARRGAATRCAR